jgi:hypothetical protein
MRQLPSAFPTPEDEDAKRIHRERENLVQEIVARLNSEGLTSSTGKPFTVSMIRSGWALCVNTRDLRETWGSPA